MTKPATEDDVARPTSAVRRWRPWIPIVVLLVSAGTIVWIQRFADIEAGFRVVYSAVAIAITWIALLIWFARLGTIARRFKLVAIAAMGLAILGFLIVFEIDFRGNLYPILRYRFAGTPPTPEVVAGSVDLTHTTEYDYPRFLGTSISPRFDGVTLDTDWQQQPPKLIWRQPIGEGFSSFAVVGEFAVTQQQSFDKQQELVVCYHWPTGEVRWRHADDGYFESSLGGRGPRATPTIDDGRVYTMGAMGLLNCLDGSNGQVIWSRNVVEENDAPLPDWGKSNSPLIVDSVVVVSAGGPNGKSLVAYDKLDGTPIWSAGSDDSSYSSPQLLTIAGVPQIVSFNRHSVTAHDPQNEGKLLWTFDFPGGMPNVAQPMLLPGDKLLLSKEYSTGSLLFQVSHVGEAWTTEEIWSNKKLMKTKFTNPVYRDGYVYGMSDVLLQCIEPFEGKQQWILRGEFGNGHVVLVGDLLLV